MSSSLLFQDLGNCCQNCSHCFLSRISFVIWSGSSQVIFVSEYSDWMSPDSFSIQVLKDWFLFFDWSSFTVRVMLYDDSIILIVNIFRVISFDNLIHIIVLRLCFVRTRRDLVDWFIFFSSLCVSFFLVSPQLSKWFPDTLWKQNCWVCWEDSQIRCPLKCIDLNLVFLFVFFQMWTFLIFTRTGLRASPKYPPGEESHSSLAYK